MIIFLGGSKDAGKTTTAQLLLSMDPKFAVVEPDVFYAFLPDTLSILEKAPLCVYLSALCVRALHEAGYSVIVAYPLTDADHARYLELLSDIDRDEFVFITLAPDKDVLLSRLRLFDDASPEAEFRRRIIDLHYEHNGRGFGVVYGSYPTHRIDSSYFTPEETAECVYSLIEEEREERNARKTVRS